MKLYTYKYIYQYPFQNITIEDNSVLHLIISIEEGKETVLNEQTINTSNLEKNIIYTLNFLVDGYYSFLSSELHEPVSADAALRIYVSNSGEINLYAPIRTNISPSSNVEIIYVDQHIEKLEEKNRNNIQFNFRNELTKNYPEYHNSTISRAYHDMLHDLIDPNYACAYLDAQVEILTKILMNILDKHPELFDESSIEDYEEIKNLLAETSLFNIKSSNKIVQELANKKPVRDMQQTYYKFKKARAIGEQK